MGPVELLRNKRAALVSDDEAILLLLIGKGAKRPHELREESGMPERTFWRCFASLNRMEWIESDKSHPTGQGVGPGLRTILKLSDKGKEITAIILGQKLAIAGVPPIRKPDPNGSLFA